MRIHLIAAARPNFMKIAPLYHELNKQSWAEPMIVHTGQHYDLSMSDVFFQDLHLPEPDLHLGVGSGSHAEQTGRVMIAYEKVLMQNAPDLVVVVGDVNSTMAATITAVKLGIKVAHLEAGLRSFDRTMPEEINRLITDTLADILWTPSPDADENLRREGVSDEKIVRVGNIMIDSLEMLRSAVEAADTCSNEGLSRQEFGLVTLHRPANVDDPEKLTAICRALVSASQKMPLVFPVHPRTRNNLNQYDILPLLEQTPALRVCNPMSYVNFMNLVFNSKIVITDSGGIQEETTYLGIPCLTLRPNTERPVTIEQGTNRLCTTEELENCVNKILSQEIGGHVIPDLWDGKTAGRVVKSINDRFQTRSLHDN